MVRTIYIVRHCQAEGQAREAKLTESGRRQAERLAHFFLDKNIDYIVSILLKGLTRRLLPWRNAQASKWFWMRDWPRGFCRM